MYLEHISVVRSVRGDISRTAALEKASALGLLALSLRRLAEPGRLPRQRLAVIAVDMALLLRRQLRKASPDRCCSQSVLLCPPLCCPWREKGQGSLPSSFIHPDRLYLCTGLTVHLRKAYTRKATANPFLNEKLLISHQRHQWETVLAFYLAPLRDVQSPVKGQGDRMPGWEAGLQRWNNGACWELF